MMKRFTKKVFCYKNGDDVAIVFAHSHEEAMYKFEKGYPDVTGDKVREVEYNHLDIGVINKGGK